jgi:hypothetical protein
MGKLIRPGKSTSRLLWMRAEVLRSVTNRDESPCTRAHPEASLQVLVLACTSHLGI